MSMGFISLQRYNGKHREDVALALLAAARRHDVKTVRCFILHDPTIIELCPGSPSDVPVCPLFTNIIMLKYVTVSLLIHALFNLTP